MSTNIVMPEMGEGVVEGTVARWLKQVGDTIEEFEPVLEIETDKVTTEAVAEATGTLLEIRVEPGATVPVGTVLGVIGRAGETVAPDAIPDAAGEEPAPAAARPAVANGAPREEALPVKRYTRQTDVGWVSPVVARMVAAHDLDLTQIDGTGKNGRITKKDVEAYLDRREAQPAAAAQAASAPATTAAVAAATAAATPIRTAPAPAIPTPAGVPGELMRLSNMRRRIAEHMVMSKRVSPHVTTVFEADFSAITAHRRAQKAAFAQKGVRLTFTPYLILALAQALARHPQVNSSWREDGIQLHRDIHIGMATALDDGLIVPVIKHADSFNLLGASRVVNDLAERARTNKLKPDEVQGGTFSLTNHGVSGSLFATPIINQPQCGILGVGAIQKRVVVVTDAMGNDAMAIRPMAYLSFTFDHRILDGASADYFVADVKATLEGWPAA